MQRRGFYQEVGLALFLVFLCLVIYGSVASFQLVQMDDPKHIFENKDMLFPTWDGLFRYWTAGFFSLYIPMTYSFWMGASAVFKWWAGSAQGVGLSPHTFHLLNWMVHTGNVLLLFFLIRTLISRFHYSVDKNDLDESRYINGAAFLGAGLFAFHPMQVEPVAWISGMKDLLSTWWVLLAMSVYYISIEIRRSIWRKTFYCLGTVFFVFGMLSKPSVVVLPLLVVGINRWLLGFDWKESRWGMIGWLVVAIPFAALTKAYQADAGVEFVAPFFTRIFIALDALFFYLCKLVFPHPLFLDYGHSSENVSNSVTIFWSWIIPMGVAVGLWLKAKQKSWVWGGVILFAVALFPTLGIVPFKFQQFSTVADRYVYFPMIFLSLLLGWWWCQEDRLHLQVIPFIVLVIFCTLSFRQTLLWQDSESAFNNTLKHNPQSYLCHNNLGFHFYTLGRYSEAAYHFRQVTLIRPNDVQIFSNLGATLVRMGEVNEGIGYLKKVLEHQPNSVQVRHNLAEAYFAAKDFENAGKEAREVLNRMPHNYRMKKILIASQNQDKEKSDLF